MALRYSSKGAAVAQAGTAFPHGLGAVPDEWAFNYAAAPPAGSFGLYKTSADSTNLNIASTSGATTADVFAVVNHTVIK